jgi:hypothetical protein
MGKSEKLLPPSLFTQRLVLLACGIFLASISNDPGQ